MIRFTTYFMLLLFSYIPISTQSSLEINLRDRIPSEKGENQFETQERVEIWKTGETALIICDMWDKHWCQSATDRVSEMAPVMNEVVKIAREQGVFIIHAPSDVIDYYEGHPARERAIAAPKATNTPTEIKNWCSWLDENETKVYPIDQSDGGCDCPDCKSYRAWSKQIETIEIFDEDAISDSGYEVWNLLEAEGIKNVILLGVHVNMCVLGRPFGLRNMKRYGKNVVLMRDMTDSMYNPKSWPYVSHFKGTALIIEHIEKYVCPTISSSDFTQKSDFIFAQNK